MIYIQGVFDLFHKGHINLLKKASKISQVMVALVTDEAVESYKGKKPIMSYEEREILLLSCKYVWKVVPTNIKNTKGQILLFNPDFVILGSDWVNKDIYKQYNMTPEELDPYLLFFPYTKGISSTNLKERVRDGNKS